MAIKILVLGSGGMLGHTLFKYFSEQAGFETYGTARAKGGLAAYYSEEELRRIYDGVDADKFDSIIDVFGKVRLDVVINCIGIIKQLKEAEDPLLCLNINALFPHRLAHLAAASGVRVIHISTDCVFDGKKGDYTEEDQASAYDLYGKTKNLGELTQYMHAVTLRTSIIGHELNKSLSLVDWFLAQQQQVKGYTRAIYSGFPTIELARIIKDYVLPRPELSGLYHVSSDPINKYELLRLVADIYGKQIEILPFANFVLDRSLNSDRFRKAVGYAPPSWHELIVKMHDEYVLNQMEKKHVC